MKATKKILPAVTPDPVIVLELSLLEAATLWALQGVSTAINDRDLFTMAKSDRETRHVLIQNDMPLDFDPSTVTMAFWKALESVINS